MTRLNFVLDVDGVMNTGQFLYSKEGKAYKVFGPHDYDGLKLLKDKLQIKFITADRRGYSITKKRIVEDMRFELDLISEQERFNYIKQNFDLKALIYMGDGYHDAKILRACKFGIAPANARKEAKEAADFVTESRSAEGAVFDACIEINKRFFTEKRMNYKVCILAAGKGSRMVTFCKTFNKALIPVKGKPAICHIIEKFPEKIEIIIPVGYKKETIKTFLNTNYPKRMITYVDVVNWHGPGSGPGYSLLCCKKYLQSPFVQVAADTLVAEDIPFPNKNWIGVAKVSNTERFSSAKVNKGKVVCIDDKIKTKNEFALIGLFGIKDYELFWEKLENNKNLINGELQVSNGLISLLEKTLFAKNFTWFDVGTPEAYKYTLDNFPYGKSYQER